MTERTFEADTSSGATRHLPLKGEGLIASHVHIIIPWDNAYIMDK